MGRGTKETIEGDGNVLCLLWREVTWVYMCKMRQAAHLHLKTLLQVCLCPTSMTSVKKAALDEQLA